jgi:hypothetical protein
MPEQDEQCVRNPSAGGAVGRRLLIGPPFELVWIELVAPERCWTQRWRLVSLSDLTGRLQWPFRPGVPGAVGVNQHSGSDILDDLDPLFSGCPSSLDHCCATWNEVAEDGALLGDGSGVEDATHLGWGY